MRCSLKSASLLISCTFFAASASAQVQSLDPNYTVSLLASGVQVPDGGMVYRPSTNDFLVTEEDQGQIVSVNAATGTVTGSKAVAGEACSANSPLLKARRHANTWLAFTPCARATNATLAPGSNVNSTMRRFSETERNRRARPSATSA